MGLHGISARGKLRFVKKIGFPVVRSRQKAFASPKLALICPLVNSSTNAEKYEESNDSSPTSFHHGSNDIR